MAPGEKEPLWLQPPLDLPPEPRLERRVRSIREECLDPLILLRGTLPAPRPRRVRGALPSGAEPSGARQRVDHTRDSPPPGHPRARCHERLGGLVAVLPPRDLSLGGVFGHYGARLRAKLTEVFRRSRSRPIGRVIEEINPILRGWVNYFRIGHASRCFGFVRDWVEKKVRRHMMRARGRRGFGWNRWSRAWLSRALDLYSDYGVRYWSRA